MIGTYSPEKYGYWSYGGFKLFFWGWDTHKKLLGNLSCYPELVLGYYNTYLSLRIVLGYFTVLPKCPQMLEAHQLEVKIFLNFKYYFLQF